MKKVVMVIMIILTICLLMAMNLEVKASGSSDNPIDASGDLDITIGGEDTANATEANAIAANQIEANQIAANSQSSQVIQPDINTTTNGTEENTLPKTGVTEDITVMFFIIVCVISAVYAYKKIKDYNA